MISLLKILNELEIRIPNSIPKIINATFNDKADDLSYYSLKDNKENNIPGYGIITDGDDFLVINFDDGNEDYNHYEQLQKNFEDILVQNGIKDYQKDEQIFGILLPLKYVNIIE